MVIDTVHQQLVSTQQQLDNGTYIFDNTETTETAEVDDLLVGIKDGGYLRKVTSVSTSGNQVTYETTQGRMSELFENGTVDLSVDLNSSTQYKSIMSHVISSTILYDTNGVLITASGSIGFSMDSLLTDIDFGILSVNRFSLETVNAQFNANLDVSVDANGNLPLLDFEKNTCRL